MLLPHALTHRCKGKGDAVVWSLTLAGLSAQCKRRVVVIRLRRMAEEDDERSSIAARPTPTKDTVSIDCNSTPRELTACKCCHT